MPLTGGAVRVAHMLDPDEPAPVLSWDRDGTLYLARALPKDPAPSIWRMSPPDGALSRITDLSDRCTLGSITVGALGHAAVCLGEDLRSDIWLVETGREKR